MTATERAKQANGSSAAMQLGTWVRVRVGRRKYPMVATALVCAVGLGVMFGVDPIYAHTSGWYTPGDEWGVFRGAHYVGWGYLGGIYSSGTGIVTLPGFSVLLAPVAMISYHFHLTESYSPIFLRHPTAALLLQPAELLLTSSVIFAADALAERLDVTAGRRVVLCGAIASLALPVAVVWGHAEDALAMTFAIYALIAWLDRKWARSGWILGFGIAMQPLALLILPLIIGASPAGQRVKTAIRATALSAVLVGIAALGNAADTFSAIVRQPSTSYSNHATPWLALAPRIATPGIMVGQPFSLGATNGHATLKLAAGSLQHPVVVSGGPGRTIYLVIAVLLGIFVWRRPQPPLRVLWLCAAILAARCVFEAFICPYYLAPPLFLALVMGSRGSRSRFGAALMISAAASIYAYLYLDPWIWWLPVVAGMAAVVGLGYPTVGVKKDEEPNGVPVDRILIERAAIPTAVRLLEPTS